MIGWLRSPSVEIAAKRPYDVFLSWALVDGHWGNKTECRVVIERFFQFNEDFWVYDVVVIKEKQVISSGDFSPFVSRGCLKIIFLVSYVFDFFSEIVLEFSSRGVRRTVVNNDYFKIRPVCV